MGGDEMCFFQEAYESNCIAPMGPQVDAFQWEFCEKVGISYAAAVSMEDEPSAEEQAILG
jgi:pyridoxal phosphate-dependent aminotransferase EpsN